MSLRAWLIPLRAPPHLGLKVGVQQDVAIQVDGEDVAIGPQLQEDRRRVRLRVALWHNTLGWCHHPHLCRQSSPHVTPRAQPVPSIYFCSQDNGISHPWGESLALDFSHCSFPQACKVYSLLTLQGFLLCSGSRSIMQL